MRKLRRRHALDRERCAVGNAGHPSVCILRSGSARPSLVRTVVGGHRRFGIATVGVDFNGPVEQNVHRGRALAYRKLSLQQYTATPS